MAARLRKSPKKAAFASVDGLEEEEEGKVIGS
jgi:hypothetical protein